MALGKDMRIDRIQISRGEPSITSRIISNKPKTPLFVSSMQMTFPSTTDADKGNKEVEELRTRLQKLLPDHIVKVSKMLEDYEYSEEIVVETGDENTALSSQDYIAEISIEGPAVE